MESELSRTRGFPEWGLCSGFNCDLSEFVPVNSDWQR